ncbi:hypothetical protein J4731_23175 [Providencia rettgeri]|nr:hypothetical protein [Providencia rettgeri]
MTDDSEIFLRAGNIIKKLRDIGPTINSEPLDFKHTQLPNWEDNVKFNPDKLAFQLTF